MAHAPPEIVEGKRPTEASDVYSLASTLYTMIAGDGPFSDGEETSIVTMISRIVTRPVPDLRARGVPDPVCAVLEQGLAKDPAMRPRAAAFGRALQQAQRALGVPVADMTLVSVTLPAPDPTVTGARRDHEREHGRGGARLRQHAAAHCRGSGDSSDDADAGRAARRCPGVPAGGAGETPKKGKGPLIAIGGVVVAALVIGGGWSLPRRAVAAVARRRPTRSREAALARRSPRSPTPSWAQSASCPRATSCCPMSASSSTRPVRAPASSSTRSGLAVTNNHVVAGAATLQVFVNGDDKPRNARVVGRSECDDLAVIDIAGDGYPFFVWSTAAVAPGDPVHAAGFAAGDTSFALTDGTVSSVVIARDHMVGDR